MSSPYKGEGRGIAMLNLLRTLSQSIAPSMADMWEQEIPLLVQYLEGEGPTLCACRGTRWTCDLNDRNLGAGGPEQTSFRVKNGMPVLGRWEGKH